MRNLLMVRYGEIYLKGLNRPYFLGMLVDRVKQAVRPQGCRVWLHDARIFVSDIQDMDDIISRVTKVFGVHSVCPAVEMDKNDFEQIKIEAAKMMEGLSGTFKVSARRADKRYPLDSPEINARLGEAVLDHCPGLSVDVHHPQHVLSVEIRDFCYLYENVIPAAGGLPVGVSGKATLLLSGGIDSPVAGYMIGKRGVEISAVHFFSFPYTSERAKEKVLDLCRILSPSLCGVKLYVVPFTEIQMEIHEKCPDEYTTLIMRRYMMRIAKLVADKEGAGAIVTGESLGQVASQTMEALAMTDEIADRPVFRPLIGMDKIDIIHIAEKIGTYETSCLPYEDCCTVFTPRHPATHPKKEKILMGEEKLDTEGLLERAMAGVEIVEL